MKPGRYNKSFSPNDENSFLTSCGNRYFSIPRKAMEKTLATNRFYWYQRIFECFISTGSPWNWAATTNRFRPQPKSRLWRPPENRSFSLSMTLFEKTKDIIRFYSVLGLFECFISTGSPWNQAATTNRFRPWSKFGVLVLQIDVFHVRAESTHPTKTHFVE